MKMSTKIRRILSIVEKKEDERDADLLVGASVIAAMAYQAAISPPGGVAGMDAQINITHSAHDGTLYDLNPAASLLAYFYYSLSNVFWISNTISLLGSLSVILIYISGLKILNRKIVIWPIRLTMCTSLLSMTVAYVCAVLATTPTNTNIGDINNTRKGLVVVIIVYAGVVLVLLLCLVIRFIRYMVREITEKNASEEAEAAADTDIA